MCGACERDKSSTMIQMYGQPYNQNTLKPIPPDETARLHRVKYLFVSLKAHLINIMIFLHRSLTVIQFFLYRTFPFVRNVAI